MPLDLLISFGSILQTPAIFPERQGKVQVTVTNQGDQAVTQPFNVSLYASTNPTLDSINQLESTTLQVLKGKDELLGTLKVTAGVNQGQSRTFTLDLTSAQFRTASVVSPGAYYLIAEVDSGKTIPESNNNNNIASQFISTAKTDVVLDWNSTLLNALQAEGERLRDKPTELPIASPPFAARNAAIVHTAIYQAVTESSGTSVSRQAAVVGAAYQTLADLYKEQKPAFDAQRNRSLAEIQDSATAESAGFNLGVSVAKQILAKRRNDGAAGAQVPFTVPPTPGVWRPTPTRGETVRSGAQALLPRWGDVTPFVISSVEDVIPALIVSGPPKLGTLQYALSVNLVKSLGSRDRSFNTQIGRNQAEIAYFWSYDRPDTFGPPGQWQEIAQEVALQRNNTLEQNARLFALLTIAMADAGIATWDIKYTYNQWRPITAIREADTDPNPRTVKDPNWTPLLDTPPFPDYVSGHAAFGAAAGRILNLFFGTNNVSFNIPSQDLPGVSRSYTKFSEAVRENALSRVYGGIHVGPATLDGVVTGEVVGRAVAESVFYKYPIILVQ